MPTTTFFNVVWAFSKNEGRIKLKNIKKNKFLLILMTFIVFIFAFYSNAFAFSFVYEGNTYNVSDFGKDSDRPVSTILYRDNSFFLVFSREHYTRSSNPKDVLLPIGYNSSMLFSSPLYYKLVNNEWYLIDNSHSSSDYADTSFNLSMVRYSNLSIYDGHNNVVFPVAPQTVGQVTIPEIQQVEEIPQVMGEVMKMIIPIGLIIFGIFLLILVMRLVISRIA